MDLKNIQLSEPFQTIYDINDDILKYATLADWVHWYSITRIFAKQLNELECNGMSLLEFSHKYLKNLIDLENVTRLLVRYGYNVLESVRCKKYNLNVISPFLPKKTKLFPNDIGWKLLFYVKCPNPDVSNRLVHRDIVDNYPILSENVYVAWELGYHLSILIVVSKQYEDIKQFIPEIWTKGHRSLLIRYALTYGYLCKMCIDFPGNDVVSVKFPKNMSILTMCVLFGSVDDFKMLLELGAKINTFDDLELNWITYFYIYRKKSIWKEIAKLVTVNYNIKKGNMIHYYPEYHSLVEAITNINVFGINLRDIELYKKLNGKYIDKPGEKFWYDITDKYSESFRNIFNF